MATYKRKKAAGNKRRYIAPYLKDDGTYVKGHYRAKTRGNRYRTVKAPRSGYAMFRR